MDARIKKALIALVVIGAIVGAVIAWRARRARIAAVAGDALPDSVATDTSPARRRRTTSADPETAVQRSVDNSKGA